MSLIFALKGRQGDKGDKGDKGDQGDKGDKGDKGDQGDQGTAAYTDSGNQANPHFSVGDFNKNGSWHELDLSGIIPENTKLVLISGIVYENAGEKIFRFSTNGAASVNNVMPIVTKGTNKYTGYSVWVHPDANRKIQYKIPSSTWQAFDLTVCGWLL